LCDPTGGVLTAVAIGATATAGGTSAYSQYQQGASQKKYYNSLADRSTKEGQAALETADRQSTAVQDTAKISGERLAKDQQRFNATTRSELSARGISGAMAEDLISSNFTNEEMDKLILKNNADLKSWEINTQGAYSNWASINEANDYRYAGKSAKRAGAIGAFTTLLGTAAQVASMSAGAGSPKGGSVTNTGGPVKMRYGTTQTVR